jgi:endonuclease/exonuclease/phosphatase family metal-dependent hydrolase
MFTLSKFILFSKLPGNSDSVPNTVKKIKVATMNLYNTNKLWKERFRIIAELIIKHQIDIVGIQEVRTITEEQNRNQMEELMQHLPKYKHIYEPVMNVADPNQNGATVEEGLAIISKHPISNIRTLHQRSTTKNWNNRLCYNAVITKDGTDIDFYVTHQAIDPVDQCTKMKQILEFMNERKDMKQIILGDFNTYYDFPYPMDVLSMNTPQFRTNMFQNKNCEQECQKKKFDECVKAITPISNDLPLTDIWQQLHPLDNGHTFTNYKDQDMSRPDRILYRGGLIADDALVTGDEPLPSDNTVYVSDHRMVVGSFSINE